MKTVRPICRYAACAFAIPTTISIGYLLFAYKPWNGPIGPNLAAALQLSITFFLIAIGILFAIAGVVRRESYAGLVLCYYGVVAISIFLCFAT